MIELVKKIIIYINLFKNINNFLNLSKYYETAPHFESVGNKHRDKNIRKITLKLSEKNPFSNVLKLNHQF